MLIHNLWIVFLLSSFVSAKQRALKLQTYEFEATVQDSGTFLGAKCDKMKQECAAYKKKLCKFIEKPLSELAKPYDFCHVTLLSDRSPDNKINVHIAIDLINDTLTGGLYFNVLSPSFGAALKLAFRDLYNTTDASVTITKVLSTIKTPEATPDLVVIKISGPLKRGETTLEVAKLTDEEKCQIEKQFFNQEFANDLVNVMYKYAMKNMKLLPAAQNSPNELSFNLFYPKKFFDDTGIYFKEDFYTGLQWGFSNIPSTKNYNFGGQAKAEYTPGVTEPTRPTTIPFSYTTTVKDDGKLWGKQCSGSKEACADYKQNLCRLAQQPLACGRVPMGWTACSADILNERAPGVDLDAKVTLEVQETLDGLHPITLSPSGNCQTFAALYKLMFTKKTQNPTLTIKEFTPPLKPVVIKADKVELEITGTLYNTNEPVPSANWDSTADATVQTELLNLKLVEPMLNTFYHASPTVEKFSLDSKAGESVLVSLTISYPKTLFEENGIDPECDLNDMLQWGLRATKPTKGHYFGQDTVVKNSLARELFRFKATVYDSGKFQGAKCNLKSEKCIEYKENLCNFIRKPLLPLNMSPKEFCTVEILSDRTEKNELNVSVSLKLNMNAPTPTFDVNCPTFGGLLNETFKLVHNTPDAGLLITEILSFQLPSEIPQDTVVLQVIGTLYSNGNPVNTQGFQLDDKCYLGKQLSNLDMRGDLLNVMYKYNRDNIHVALRTIDQPNKVNFTLFYNASFFQTAQISSKCDFIHNLEWGFRNPVKTNQYYLGPDTTITELPTDRYYPATKTFITYKVTVTDGGNLNGHECRGVGYPCAAYERELCQLITKPLLCTRAPNQPFGCEVTGVSRTKSKGPLTADVTIYIRETFENKTSREQKIFPVKTATCKTFKALHKLALKTLYDSPKIKLDVEPLTQEEKDLITGPVSFTITGTLYHDGQPVRPEKWNPADEFEVRYQLVNLEMPGQLLQTIYKYNKNRRFEFVKPVGKTFDGQVQFKVTFPQKYFITNAIDPLCDLKAALQWGFQNSKTSQGYHLGTDAAVSDPEMSAPAA